MPVDLNLVESVGDIQKSLVDFVSGATANSDLARSLITRTSFWVYDPVTEDFGPSKFVGFRDMDFRKYKKARAGDWTGDAFDGHETRNRIEQVLGAGYVARDGLRIRLRQWLQSLFPDSPDVLAGVDSSKWEFVSLPGQAKPEDWSDQEVKSTVADYMEMLRKELAGVAYSKTDHRNALLKLLPQRNKGGVEFKHCNISAILQGMGLPYIDGYKPRGNYQAALKLAIEAYLSAHGEMKKAVRGELDQPVTAPPDGSKFRLETIEDPPPEGTPKPPQKSKGTGGHVGKTDWDLADAAKRKLGKQGEKFVLDLEVRCLNDLGRPDLAAQVEWTARDKGDGCGYDIRSFDDTGGETFIEVKTTRGPRSMPFLLTANEIKCAGELGAKYRLYRVYHFGPAVRLYRLSAPLEDYLTLTPSVFVATAK